MQGGGFRGARRDHDRVLHGTVLFELPNHVRNGRLLLAHRHVDAFDARALLVDDRVDGHGRFARLPVADDQLPLTAANGHHGIDRLETGLNRLAH